MDICFIVDTSVSVDGQEWDDLRQFMEDVVSSLDPVGNGPDDMHIGYLTYSGSAEMSAGLNAYGNKQAAIDGIWNDIKHLAGSTKTDLGLDLCRTDCFSQAGESGGSDTHIM